MKISGHMTPDLVVRPDGLGGHVGPHGEQPVGQVAPCQLPAELW